MLKSSRDLADLIRNRSEDIGLALSDLVKLIEDAQLVTKCM